MIYRITGLTKVGDEPGAYFIGKKLDHKLVVKLTRELKLTKGTRAYDPMNIEDCSLCFIIQLLAGKVLRKCRPNEVPKGAIDLSAHVKEGKQYSWCVYLLN